MNPLWILVGMGVLWRLCSLVADLHEIRRETAEDDWRGERREELHSLKEALLVLPLFPIVFVMEMPEMLTTGRPLLWGAALGGSLLWLIALVLTWSDEDDGDHPDEDEDRALPRTRQLTSHDMSIGASPSGRGSESAQDFPSGGGVGS